MSELWYPSLARKSAIEIWPLCLDQMAFLSEGQAITEGVPMNLLPLLRDTVDELLARIIDFTNTREEVLAENIQNMHTPGFVPKDLAVGEFCGSLNHAIVEHVQNQRLVLRDTDNIEFGTDESLRARPVVDDYANRLLETNRDEYLKVQMRRLSENLLNRKIAQELLKQRQGTTPSFKQLATGRPKHRHTKATAFSLYWHKTQH